MNGLRTVLVAEDDANDLFLLRRAFMQASVACRLVHLPDGRQVVGYLGSPEPRPDPARHPWPDLVLLDLKMPLMDGFEVLAWLRAQPQLGRIPAVVLSSSALDKDRARAFALGARAFYTKPGGLAELVRLVSDLRDHWLEPRLPETLRSIAGR